jgi:hypothetical protein
MIKVHSLYALYFIIKPVLCVIYYRPREKEKKVFKL